MLNDLVVNLDWFFVNIFSAEILLKMKQKQHLGEVWKKRLFLEGIRMKLYIKQRLFSWTDSFDIYDENMDKKYTA